MCDELKGAWLWPNYSRLVRSGCCLLICCAAVVVAYPVPSAAQHTAQQQSVVEEEQQLVLALSEQTTLSAKNVRSYSEGTRGIVDVRLTRDASQFVLVGQRVGTTSLLLIMMDGAQRQLKITVEDPNAQAVPVTNELSVARQDNIRLDFYFVQFNRSNNRRVGIAPPGSLTMGTAQANFNFLTRRFESATAVVENQALLRLDMAQASGWAKLMRQAALITENGQAARFYGGGEVNIPVQGSLTTGIHSIEYGSMVEVLPRYDASTGRLQIALSADVSDLTDDQGSGAPGRVRSTLNTVVNLEVGQAVVLAGLSSESKLKSHTGLPFLSQIPIFGLLFGGERMTHQAADNVVFIVPTVVEATSEQAKQRIERAFAAYRKYSGQERVQRDLRETMEDSDAKKN